MDGGTRIQMGKGPVMLRSRRLLAVRLVPVVAPPARPPRRGLPPAGGPVRVHSAWSALHVVLDLAGVHRLSGPRRGGEIGRVAGAANCRTPRGPGTVARA